MTTLHVNISQHGVHMIKIVYIVPLVLALVGLSMAQCAHAISDTELMKTNPYAYGYQQGVSDGKDNARDATSACEGYNSTSENDECSHGYDLGFKKGCESYHLPPDSDPEYGQCRTY
jgi:hypothetical protein